MEYEHIRKTKEAITRIGFIRALIGICLIFILGYTFLTSVGPINLEGSPMLYQIPILIVGVFVFVKIVRYFHEKSLTFERESLEINGFKVNQKPDQDVIHKLKDTPQYRLSASSPPLTATMICEKQGITLINAYRGQSRHENTRTITYLLIPEFAGRYYIHKKVKVSDNNRIGSTLLTAASIAKNIEDSYGLPKTAEDDDYITYGTPPQNFPYTALNQDCFTGFDFLGTSETLIVISSANNALVGLQRSAEMYDKLINAFIEG